MTASVLEAPRQVYGIDFSGAKDAGRRIWIAHGTVEGDGLHIHACRRAEELPDSGRDRDRCLAALSTFIAEQRGCAIGLDFPFSLPKPLLDDGSWEDFVRTLADRYTSPEAFRRRCFAEAGNRELRRRTDNEARTPFSPYNVRLFRQTYYGIRDVLRPLVLDRTVCVLPMQEPMENRPWLLEICPASTLKHKDLRLSYKGRSEARRINRRLILARLEEWSGSSLSLVRADVEADHGGDALDSLLAAFATYRALCTPERMLPTHDDVYVLEGCVYV
jgi:hypothetical protein